MATTIPLYQVDAFAERLFTGNPAAVCPLDRWLPADTMQRIALENNLSETAFFVDEPGGLRIRWFTPAAEVRLCGHATLASCHVYFRHIAPNAQAVTFDSLSGELEVRRDGDRLLLDLPVGAYQRIEPPAALTQALGHAPVETHAGTDWIVLLPSEASVRSLRPNLGLLRELDARGVIVTAKGVDHDFVSRFFAPKVGVDEDPVTGSAHTLLTPFWAQRLGKSALRARQLSKRGGELFCELQGDRVLLGGRVVPYLQGTIEL